MSTFPHLNACRAGLELSVLPAWVLDTDPLRFAWANDAAVEFWAAPSREELFARDLSKAPLKVIERTRHVIERAREGHIEFSEWTFYPRGTAKTVSVQLRGIELDEGRFGLLNQAIDIIEATPPSMQRTLALLSHSAVITALVDARGQILTQNQSATTAFGTQRSWLSWLAEAREGGPLIAKACKGATMRARLKVRQRGLSRWHDIAASPLRDPVSGQFAVLIEQHDVSEERETELLAQSRGALLSELRDAVEHELSETSDAQGRERLRQLAASAGKLLDA